MTVAEGVENEYEEKQQPVDLREDQHEQDQDQGEDVVLGQEVPTSVTVETVVIVDQVVDSGVNHEEVIITQTTTTDELPVEGIDESREEGKTFSTEEAQPEGPDESLQDGKGDEEECGFCLFMKAGPCGRRFTAWEACVDDAETSGNNIVEKCAQMTRYLKECMESNPEYYGPVLQAEKSMNEQEAPSEASMVDEEKGNSNNLEPIPA